jgi:hypothetical protein
LFAFNDILYLEFIDLKGNNAALFVCLTISLSKRGQESPFKYGIFDRLQVLKGVGKTNKNNN